MKSMIENLINGNLTDARKQAKKYSFGKIDIYLRGLGWSNDKARTAASYLKHGTGWQQYCDAA